MIATLSDRDIYAWKVYFIRQLYFTNFVINLGKIRKF